ncbi:ATP-binding protein [Streptomyces sp. LN699]|uniref:ATP-binding protein n=1 Tax=Streptomyces sp. LN699 TaxID=3112981 RepID=UPI003710972F
MDTMSVTVTPARSSTSIADARESARHFLEDLPRVITAEVAETVIMVVSELVTNALRHGGGIAIMEVSAHPDAIEVAVRDDSPRAPRMRTPDLNRGTGGFGWLMVNRLAHTTAVTPRPTGGKTVKALIAR